MVNSNAYKEKYLLLLDEHEKLEKRLNFQSELLKKTLLQVAVAASGMDAQLDASVLRLREVMRGGSGAQTVEQLEQVQRSVTQFEGQRSVENNKAVKAMQMLLNQYTQLQLPKDLKTSLASFNAALNKRLSNFRQYAPALEELAKLQLLAIQAASNQQASLWTRLRGGQTLNLEAEPASTSKADKKPKQESNQKGETSVDSESEATDSVVVNRTTVTKTPAELARNLSQDEDSYQAVAERIADTLAKLLDNIEPNDNVRHRMDIVRHRIERGMDWYVLAATLEDIRDIFMLRYLQVEDEFGLYLNQIKAELGGIGEALATAVEKEKALNSESALFAEQVQQGVHRMQKSVVRTDKIELLKGDVSKHLDFIHAALRRWQEQPQDALQDQLQLLVSQVQQFKQESEQTKAALEKQRHLATHDNLTGLPNRQSYAERAYAEWQRKQRDGLPLTIAICDIDFFKKINDSYGHQAGDKVLQLISSLISKRLRNTDYIARYGGEEFVVLMPNTPDKSAYEVLDKIREVVAKSALKFKGEPLNISISFGITAVREKETIESAFERADSALYQAKEQGRNRSVLSAEHDAPKE